MNNLFGSLLKCKLTEVACLEFNELLKDKITQKSIMKNKLLIFKIHELWHDMNKVHQKINYNEFKREQIYIKGK